MARSDAMGIKSAVFPKPTGDGDLVPALTRLLHEEEASLSDSSVACEAKGSKPVSDSALVGLKNRLLQLVALYAPGYKTTRVWLHRMRGVSMGRNVSIGLSVLIETAYPRLVSIGNNVTLGMRVVIIGHLRDLTPEAGTSNQPTVRIGDNAYIGPGVIVLPHVTIGSGAVVRLNRSLVREHAPGKRKFQRACARARRITDYELRARTPALCRSAHVGSFGSPACSAPL